MIKDDTYTRILENSLNFLKNISNGVEHQLFRAKFARQRLDASLHNKSRVRYLDRLSKTFQFQYRLRNSDEQTSHIFCHLDLFFTSILLTRF